MSATLLGMMIKRKRQFNGWSQDELAKRSGGVADQAAISRLENGLIADPGSKLIFHVARALDMSADELLSVLCVGASEAPMPSAQASTPEIDDELADIERKIRDLNHKFEDIKQRQSVVKK